jgi:hypothetical protein
MSYTCQGHDKIPVRDNTFTSRTPCSIIAAHGQIGLTRMLLSIPAAYSLLASSEKATAKICGGRTSEKSRAGVTSRGSSHLLRLTSLPFVRSPANAYLVGMCKLLDCASFSEVPDLQAPVIARRSEDLWAFRAGDRDCVDNGRVSLAFLDAPAAVGVPDPDCLIR